MIDLLLSLPGLAAIVVVICAATVQGSTGFGFNMLAAPLLAVIDPAFVPGPMLIMAMVVCIGTALREWSEVSQSDLVFSLSGRGVAALAAALTVGLMSEGAFALVFGLAVLLAVGLSLIGLRVQTTRQSLFVAGLISGYMGTLTSIGAPPMALVYQNAAPARMRATLSGFFFFGSIISIIALIGVGRFGRHDLVLGLSLVPFALIGLLLSGWSRKLLSKQRIKPVVLAVSSVSAIILVLRAIA